MGGERHAAVFMQHVAHILRTVPYVPKLYTVSTPSVTYMNAISYISGIQEYSLNLPLSIEVGHLWFFCIPTVHIVKPSSVLVYGECPEN